MRQFQYRATIAFLHHRTLLWDSVPAFVDLGPVPKEVLGHLVRRFCYPLGSYSQREVALVDAAGYVLAVTNEWNYAAPWMDPGVLPWLSVSGWTTTEDLAEWWWGGPARQQRRSIKASVTNAHGPIGASENPSRVHDTFRRLERLRSAAWFLVRNRR